MQEAFGVGLDAVASVEEEGGVGGALAVGDEAVGAVFYSVGDGLSVAVEEEAGGAAEVAVVGFDEPL